MLAGGIGFGKYSDSKKKKIQEGDLIIVLGVITTELEWVEQLFRQQKLEIIVQELS